MEGFGGLALFLSLAISLVCASVYPPSPFARHGHTLPAITARELSADVSPPSLSLPLLPRDVSRRRLSSASVLLPSSFPSSSYSRSPSSPSSPSASPSSPPSSLPPSPYPSESRPPHGSAQRLRRSVQESKRSLSVSSPSLLPAALSVPASPLVNVSVLGDGFPRGFVKWSGNYSKTLFLLTYNTANQSFSYYRSSDYGASFSLLNNIFPAGAFVDYYEQGPANRNQVVFLNSISGKLYVSSNEGLSVAPSTASFAAAGFLFHPTIAGLLFALDGPSAEFHQIFVSVDGGITWQGPVRDSSAMAITIDNSFSIYWTTVVTPADTVFFQSSEGAIYSLSALDFYHYDATPTLLSNGIPNPSLGSFILSDDYMFCESYGELGLDLYVAYNSVVFQRISFPALRPYSAFYIVDTSEHMAMVGVTLDDDTTNLYISSRRGLTFSLSLEDVAVLPGSSFYSPYLDFTTVAGLEGVYFASINLDEEVLTVMSFDKGGSWNLLNIPSDDASCDNCTFNLHLNYNFSNPGYTPSLYSTPSAPGFLLANGNAGTEGLTPSASGFLSTDGGNTWISAAARASFYHTLDSAGVLLAVPAGTSAVDTITSLNFSINQGYNWTTLTLPAPLRVRAVYSEPGETSTVVSLFGIDNVTLHWTVVHVDFAPLLSRPCMPSDYTSWTLRSSNTLAPCVLGQEAAFTRRKASSLCLNGYMHVVENVTATCACSAQDYDCDVGFARASLSAPCEALNSNLSLSCTSAGQVIYMSRGYRLVVDDQCLGGISAYMQPLEIQCPSYSNYAPTPCNATPTATPSHAPATSNSHGSSPGLIAGLAVGLVVLAAGATFIMLYMHRRATRSRQNYARLVNENVNSDTADDELLQPPSRAAGRPAPVPADDEMLSY